MPRPSDLHNISDSPSIHRPLTVLVRTLTTTGGHGMRMIRNAREPNPNPRTTDSHVKGRVEEPIFIGVAVRQKPDLSVHEFSKEISHHKH